MEKLLNVADSYGVRVLYGGLDGRNGVYYDDLKLVIIEQSLPPAMERFTLAHELGHAHHGHRESTPSNEIKADEFAARLLIKDDDYMSAEAVCEDPRYIAQELDLPLRAVEAYWRLKSVLPMATQFRTG